MNEREKAVLMDTLAQIAVSLRGLAISSAVNAESMKVIADAIERDVSRETNES